MIKLKEFRLKNKLSQRDVAKFMGLSQAQYWHLEKELSIINATQILKLCKLYNCTPNDLLGIKEIHKMIFNDLDNNNE